MECINSSPKLTFQPIARPTIIPLHSTMTPHTLEGHYSFRALSLSLKQPVWSRSAMFRSVAICLGQPACPSTIVSFGIPSIFHLTTNSCQCVHWTGQPGWHNLWYSSNCLVYYLQALVPRICRDGPSKGHECTNVHLIIFAKQSKLVGIIHAYTHRFRFDYE